MDTKQKSNSGIKIGLVVLLVLLIGTAFFATKLYNDSTETENKLVEEKKQIMQDFTAMVKQYDQAIADNEITNNNLLDAKKRIQSLIDSLKISKSSVNNLLAYKERYSSLRKEMDALFKENERLKLENIILTKSLDSTQLKLIDQSVISDSLLVENKTLINNVKDASVLQIVGLEGLGIIERSSGKQIPTERARRSDKLKICLTIAKNSLVEEGEKDILIQVIDPKNNVLGENNSIEVGDETLYYSLKITFNYTGENIDICEFIARDGKQKFEKGRYFVNLFKEGVLVTTSEFSLK